jgi:hypothetical protein
MNQESTAGPSARSPATTPTGQASVEEEGRVGSDRALGSRDVTRSYPLLLLPALIGLFAGVLVAAPFPEGASGTLAEAYVELPEYLVWAVGVIIQLSVYAWVLAYLWLGPLETTLPSLSFREAAAVAILTAAVIALPEVVAWLMGPRAAFPLPYQRARLWIVVGMGLIAMVLLTHRLARIHQGFSSSGLNVASHAALRRETKDLLAIAAVVVTLATLGSAVLEQSLQALQTELGTERYTSPIARPHVVAYGAYSTLLLAVFFAPVLIADRRGALAVRDASHRGGEAGLDARLGLDASLMERIGSVFGVLAPLLGALAAQLLP